MCVICFKKFALGQYLKEHTYIHTGQKPFKCPYEGCTKAFRQAGKLSMHKKIHQNKIFIVQKMKKRSTTSKSDDCCHMQHQEKEVKIEVLLNMNLATQETSAVSNEHLHNDDVISSMGDETPKSHQHMDSSNFVNHELTTAGNRIATQ